MSGGRDSLPGTLSGQAPGTRVWELAPAAARAMLDGSERDVGAVRSLSSRAYHIRQPPLALYASRGKRPFDRSIVCVRGIAPARWVRRDSLKPGACMATTYLKRSKEKMRQEKQREKQVERQQRK